MCLTNTGSLISASSRFNSKDPIASVKMVGSIGKYCTEDLQVIQDTAVSSTM